MDEKKVKKHPEISLSLEPNGTLCREFDALSIRVQKNKEPETGFILEDNCAQEHQQ